MPNSPLLILYYSELPVQQYGKKKWANKKRLGQKSQPLNCLWIVEQDAVVEWYLCSLFKLQI